MSTQQNATQTAHDFFDSYAAALLARDERAVADLYAVPALILFPGNSLPVTDRAQSEKFFGASWGQYEGVTETSTDITVVAETGHSIWADVTWHHNGGGPAERFIYQLVSDGGTWRIAVLTPLM